MTTAQNGQHAEETVERHSGCIVGCGWSDDDLQDSHPEWCERSVGNKAEAVTEAGWVPTQFWCSVISSHLTGVFAQSYARDSDRCRDGVQLMANVRGDIEFTEDAGGGWRELAFHMSSGEARQLAAQLVAAADSHDGVSQDDEIMRRLEKVAKHVGANIWGS